MSSGSFTMFPINYSLTSYMYIYIYIIRHIGQVGRVFANGPADLDSIPGRVIPKTLKMVLDTSLLNTHNIRDVSKVKWSNPGKGVAPSPWSWFSSYWKGSLLVALDYGKQLTTYIYIYIYKQDFALNNPQRLICHKTQPNQTTNQILKPFNYVQINELWLVLK